MIEDSRKFQQKQATLFIPPIFTAKSTSWRVKINEGCREPQLYNTYAAEVATLVE